MEQQNEEKKYKIAVIEGEYVWSYGDNDFEGFVCKNITDWTYVTEEEFRLLQWYCNQHSSNRRLICHKDPVEIIKDNIEGYLKEAEREKKRIEKLELEARKRREQEAQRAATRKKRRLEKLAAEAGMRVVPGS